VAAGVAVVGAALAVPSMGAANGFLAPIFHGSGGAFRDQHVLGALYARLDPLQIAGVWPAGDFRLAPRGAAVTDVLLVVLALAALAGLVIAIRRRSWPVVMYCGAVPATGLALFAVGSPWVGAKALVIASPGLLLAACVGCTAVRRRAAAGVAAIAIGGGVLWSNALAYQDATLAPRGQLSELARIGRLAEGRGPTLLMEYNSYGSRYFLRAADAAALSEVRLTPLLDGQPVAAGNWADTDDLQLDGLLAYRTLVIRRSPIASRPPGVYRLVWRGQTYEVWQRAAQATAPAEHLPLDGTFSPVAPAKCQDVRRLAKLAGTQGHLETVARPVPIAVRLARLALPAGWRVQPTKRSVVYPARAGVPWGGRPGDGAMVYPLRSGAVSAIVTVEQPGRYEVWLGGSIYGRASVSIDGRPAGAARHVLNYTGGYISLGVDRLSRGRHRIELAYHGGGVHPGSGGQDVRPFPIGPLVLSRVPDSRAITYVRPGDARTLCGRQLDWIEAVRGR
jgi:hypothetical protein